MAELFPSRTEAKKLFEWVIFERNQTPYPFLDDMEKTFRDHSNAVAKIAEALAKDTAYLNSEKAYVMGLLHDCGRIVDEFATKQYHGVVGYRIMNEKGYPELGRICLTHNFIDKDFDIELMPHPRDEMLFCKTYLNSIEYDDYDLLLQLADIINDLGKSCTIEYRYKSISKRYNVPYAKFAALIDKTNILKAYFDNKLGQDIYKLLGIV